MMRPPTAPAPPVATVATPIAAKKAPQPTFFATEGLGVGRNVRVPRAAGRVLTEAAAVRGPTDVRGTRPMLLVRGVTEARPVRVAVPVRDFTFTRGLAPRCEAAEAAGDPLR